MDENYRYRLEHLRNMLESSNLNEIDYRNINNREHRSSHREHRSSHREHRSSRTEHSSSRQKAVQYTQRDDEKLKKAVKEHGKKWSYISEKYFSSNRTGDSLRNRHGLLMKNKRPSTPHPAINRQKPVMRTRSKSLPVIKPQKPVSKTLPLIKQSSIGDTPYVKNGRKAFVKKKDENGREKKYRVYQGARGGYSFKRNGRKVKLNHTNGFIYER